MNYLMLICTDGVSTPEIAATMRDHTPVGRGDGRRGVRLLGNGLEGRETARTVRVRDGETLISDGPFTDTKEFIGGLDIIEAESLDEAIEVAAKHPVSWYLRDRGAAFQVRRSRSPRTGLRAAALPADVLPGRHPRTPMRSRSSCARDIESLARDGRSPRRCACSGPAGGDPSTATTVRVRDGETLLTDGPFVETKEYLAGIDILSCETMEEALELAQSHPLARFHMVEVRPFWGA